VHRAAAAVRGFRGEPEPEMPQQPIYRVDEIAVLE